jgi:hypothetical protein
MFTVTSPLRERRGREVSKSVGDLFPDENLSHIRGAVGQENRRCLQLVESCH